MTLADDAAIRRNIRATRFVILAAFLDLFIQFPIMAPYAQSLGASPREIGLIIGAYSASNLVGNVIAGFVLDRWGRKLPVLGGLIATAMVFTAYLLVQNAEQLLAVRLAHGLATAVLTPGAFALIGDSAPAAKRGSAMGASGALISVAAVLGPSLAGITSARAGVGVVFLGGALLMVIAAVVFAVVVREVRPLSTEQGADDEHVGATRSRPRISPQLVVAYLAAFTMTIGIGTLVTHLPLALTTQGESAARAGYAFTIYALVAIVGMVGPLGRLSDRHGRIMPTVRGLLLIAVGLFILGLGQSMAIVGLAMAVFGLGFGLLFPSMTALVADATSPSERGTAYGVFYAVYSLGTVVGSVASGLLHEWSGTVNGTPFLLGAAIALAAVPAVLLVQRPVAETARAAHQVTVRR